MITKISYLAHCPGHRDSNGDLAEWCVKSHENNKILKSFPTEEEAKKGLRNMHIFGDQEVPDLDLEEHVEDALDELNSELSDSEILAAIQSQEWECLCEISPCVWVHYTHLFPHPAWERFVALLGKRLSETISKSSSKQKSLWERNTSLPKIFNGTIYREPTDSELEDLNTYNLNPRDILEGLGYTIVGRGVRTLENQKIILSSLRRLIQMFPGNENYREAYRVQEELTHHLR